MKHLIPAECVPARCVDGSCPLPLAKEHGYNAIGIPYNFDCRVCSENITYCEECRYISDCKVYKDMLKEEQIRAEERAKTIDEILNLPKHKYKVYDGFDKVVVIRKDCIFASDIVKMKGGAE